MCTIVRPGRLAVWCLGRGIWSGAGGTGDVGERQQVEDGSFCAGGAKAEGDWADDKAGKAQKKDPTYRVRVLLGLLGLCLPLS